MTPTEQYVEALRRLKPGELGLLRAHAGQGLDESVGGFDLFTGLWWPLRQKDQRAPRREVAWLIAKLYAFRPIPQSPGDALARQLGRCQPNKPEAKKRFQQKFDKLLLSPLGSMEPFLQWALDRADAKNLKLDWVKLTDDLSVWEGKSKRIEWAEQFLNANK